MVYDLIFNYYKITFMQTKNENIEFLKTKVQEIRIAKFSAEINSLLQLPNNIITTLNSVFLNSRNSSPLNLFICKSFNNNLANNIYYNSNKE